MANNLFKRILTLFTIFLVPNIVYAQNILQRGVTGVSRIMTQPWTRAGISILLFFIVIYSIILAATRKLKLFQSDGKISKSGQVFAFAFSMITSIGIFFAGGNAVSAAERINEITGTWGMVAFGIVIFLLTYYGLNPGFEKSTCKWGWFFVSLGWGIMVPSHIMQWKEWFFWGNTSFIIGIILLIICMFSSGSFSIGRGSGRRPRGEKERPEGEGPGGDEEKELDKITITPKPLVVPVNTTNHFTVETLDSDNNPLPNQAFTLTRSGGAVGVTPGPYVTDDHGRFILEVQAPATRNHEDFTVRAGTHHDSAIADYTDRTPPPPLPPVDETPRIHRINADHPVPNDGTTVPVEGEHFVGINGGAIRDSTGTIVFNRIVDFFRETSSTSGYMAILTPLAPGIYTLEVSNPHGTSNRKQFEIEAEDMPEIHEVNNNKNEVSYTGADIPNIKIKGLHFNKIDEAVIIDGTTKYNAYYKNPSNNPHEAGITISGTFGPGKYKLQFINSTNSTIYSNEKEFEIINKKPDEIKLHDVYVEPVGNHVTKVLDDDIFHNGKFIARRRYTDLNESTWNHEFILPFSIKMDGPNKKNRLRYQYNFSLLYFSPSENRFKPFTDDMINNEWKVRFYAAKSIEHPNRMWMRWRYWRSALGKKDSARRRVLLNKMPLASKNSKIGTVRLKNRTPNPTSPSGEPIEAIVVALNVTLVAVKDKDGNEINWWDIKHGRDFVKSNRLTGYYRIFLNKQKFTKGYKSTLNKFKKHETELAEFVKKYSGLFTDEGESFAKILKILTKEYNELIGVYGTFRIRKKLDSVKEDFKKGLKESLKNIHEHFENVNFDNLFGHIDDYFNKITGDLEELKKETEIVNLRRAHELEIHIDEFKVKKEELEKWVHYYKQKLHGNRRLREKSLLKKIKDVIKDIENNKYDVKKDIEIIRKKDLPEDIKQIGEAIESMQESTRALKAVLNVLRNLYVKVSGDVKDLNYKIKTRVPSIAVPSDWKDSEPTLKPTLKEITPKEKVEAPKSTSKKVTLKVVKGGPEKERYFYTFSPDVKDGFKVEYGEDRPDIIFVHKVKGKYGTYKPLDDTRDKFHDEHIIRNLLADNRLADVRCNCKNRSAKDLKIKSSKPGTTVYEKDHWRILKAPVVEIVEKEKPKIYSTKPKPITGAVKEEVKPEKDKPSPTYGWDLNQKNEEPEKPKNETRNAIKGPQEDGYYVAKSLDKEDGFLNLYKDGELEGNPFSIHVTGKIASFSYIDPLAFVRLLLDNPKRMENFCDIESTGKYVGKNPEEVTAFSQNIMNWRGVLEWNGEYWKVKPDSKLKMKVLLKEEQRASSIHSINGGRPFSHSTKEFIVEGENMDLVKQVDIKYLDIDGRRVSQIPGKKVISPTKLLVELGGPLPLGKCTIELLNKDNIRTEKEFEVEKSNKKEELWVTNINGDRPISYGTKSVTVEGDKFVDVNIVGEDIPKEYINCIIINKEDKEYIHDLYSFKPSNQNKGILTLKGPLPPGTYTLQLGNKYGWSNKKEFVIRGSKESSTIEEEQTKYADVPVRKKKKSFMSHLFNKL